MNPCSIKKRKIDRKEPKTNVCTITLNLLNQRTYVDQLSCVMAVFDQQKIRYHPADDSLNSGAEFPFQATLGLDATHKQALQLNWFCSDFTLDPKNRAKSHFYPLTGQTAQRNSVLKVNYHVDLKMESRLFGNVKRLLQRKEG